MAFPFPKSLLICPGTDRCIEYFYLQIHTLPAAFLPPPSWNRLTTRKNIGVLNKNVKFENTSLTACEGIIISVLKYLFNYGLHHHYFRRNDIADVFGMDISLMGDLIIVS
jgi:hypothetical protein